MARQKTQVINNNNSEERVTETVNYEDGKSWARDDCKYCQANLRLAKKLGARLIVDKKSMDILGIEAPLKEVTK